jgi:hypothetical protein
MFVLILQSGYSIQVVQNFADLYRVSLFPGRSQAAQKILYRYQCISLLLQFCQFFLPPLSRKALPVSI